MNSKKNRDEELQRLIFEPAGQVEPYDSAEEKNYFLSLKNALETEPEIQLPQNFAHTVTEKAFRKKRLIELLKTAKMYLFVAFAFGILSASSFYFLAADLFKTLLNALRDYAFPILFGLIVFILIQIADETFVRKKTAG